MRRLARSMARFGLASSLFGAEQLVGLLRPRANGDRRRTTDAFDAVAHAARGELGEMGQAAFEAGADLQREWLGLLADAVSPRRFPRAVAGVARRSADTLAVARPDRRGAAVRRELRNKLEVYRLVKSAHRKLELPDGDRPFPLAERVARAYTFDDHEALWAVEGLGHEHGRRHLRRAGSRTEGLLRLDDGAVPESALPMLHAGFGLAAAQHVLDDLRAHASAARARRAVDTFVRLCERNSRPAHLDTALESLGLMARCFYPATVTPLDDALARSGDERLRRYFWHGLGRALYFLPVQFLPGYGSLANVLDMCEREAPPGPARDDALMGLSYAFCLVNLADPRVIEHALAACGARLDQRPFADGLGASLVMRRRITPRSTLVDELVHHRPAPAVAKRWRRLVVEPYLRRLRLEARRDGEAGRDVDDLYPELSADAGVRP